MLFCRFDFGIQRYDFRYFGFELFVVVVVD